MLYLVNISSITVLYVPYLIRVLHKFLDCLFVYDMIVLFAEHER